MIKQLKVSLANRPGELLSVVSALAEAGVDIKALEVDDRGEHGLVRMIVTDLDTAEQTLRGGDHAFEMEEVVVAEMDDRVGGLASILQLLADAGINVEALYAFVTRVRGKSLAVLTVSDKPQAEGLLTNAGVKILDHQRDLEASSGGARTSLEDHLGMDFIW